MLPELFAACTSLHRCLTMGIGRPVGCLGSSFVVYLVMQDGSLEYGERRCGFNTKHQSTTEASLTRKRHPTLRPSQGPGHRPAVGS